MSFKSGEILTKEMLDGLHFYSYDFASLLYSDYSDGIISGLQIQTLNNQYLINKGVLKYKGLIYLLKESVDISSLFNDLNEGKFYFINGIPREEKLNNVEYHYLDFTVCDKENGFHFAKFLYRKNTRIRSDYQELQHFMNNDYFDIQNQHYAFHYEPAYHPMIIKHFVQKIMSIQSENPPVFWVIAGKAFNNEIVSMELLKEYFKFYQITDHIVFTDLIKTLNKCINHINNDSKAKDMPLKENQEKIVDTPKKWDLKEV